MLLPMKIFYITEEWGYIKDLLVAYDSDCIKIILALLTKIVAVYIQARIV